MNIELPDYALILLVGASGTGKSTFAAQHFLPTEVVSSDRARGWVLDDENSQEATPDAFDLVHAIIEKRLKNRRLTVVDATNVQPNARKTLIGLAKSYHALVVAFVFDLPEAVAVARNTHRPDRAFGSGPIRRQMQDLRRSFGGLQREGVRYVHRLSTIEEVDAVRIERRRLWTDRREDAGPFDIIGDVHGCADELEELLTALGYEVAWKKGDVSITSPAGRRAIFLGDLVDRGPRSPDVLRMVRHLVEHQGALAVLGNHDDKLKRHLAGRKVSQTHGLPETIAQMGKETADFVASMRQWLDGLISHYVLDGGALVVAHAGLRESMHNRASGAIRAYAMYGETSGEVDEFGLPVRINWARDYKGKAKVVHGHTPVKEPTWTNGTLCIDTGCCFGGKLTALRYPEMTFISVPARRVYAAALRAGPRPEDVSPKGLGTFLDLNDVIGRQVIETRLLGRISLREQNTAAALETMSRFAVDPRWLITLPPTMSPPETSEQAGWLERPEEAFAYYASRGTRHLVLEHKHMGSRALIVLTKKPEVAERRFGVVDGSRGIVVTRTGRRFFRQPGLEASVLERLDQAMNEQGIWRDLGSDWVLWDVEIMPWNLKAEPLIRDQYAAVGASATAGLMALQTTIAAGQARGLPLVPLAESVSTRLDNARRFCAAFGKFHDPASTIDALKIAAFHLLASEGKVHDDKNHLWHMTQSHRLAQADPSLWLATDHREVDLGDSLSVREAVAWWELLTSDGEEGMVVKPLAFVPKGPKQLLQPAIKCRGREYLRLVYGPDYDRPENLSRLRMRALNHKRSLALREFSLGLEALERFVARAPLSRVHQCVFGVLALESEPVDPRL